MNVSPLRTLTHLVLFLELVTIYSLVLKLVDKVLDCILVVVYTWMVLTGSRPSLATVNS